MKDQNQINLSEDNIANQPATQSEAVPVNKARLLIPILITFLATALIFGLTGYYSGTKSKQSKPTEKTLPTPISEKGNEVVIPSPNPTKTTNKITLSKALSQFCLDSKISLDKLPFTLDQSVKATYNVQNSVNCLAPNGNYASMSTKVENSDSSDGARSIYFFNKNSKYMGMLDNFQSLDNYKMITVNDQNYWLNIIEPDPYGISSLGIQVELIGEKQDLPSGTIVRIMSSNILKDQQFIDLVKKYGSQLTDTDDDENYYVNDNIKRNQFINEFIGLAPQNNTLKATVQDINSDLNGISF